VDIYNPTTLPNVQYMEYVTYKANGGELAINDFIAKGMPQPGSPDGGIYSLGRTGMQILKADGKPLVMGPVSRELLPVYQQAMDDGYALAVQRRDAGLLNIPNGVPENTVLGSVADRFARGVINAALQPGGPLAHLSGDIVVNRRLYNTTGSGYTIPDLRIPAEGVIIDGTIGYKDNSTPQVKNFLNYDPNYKTVVIVAPQRAPSVLRGK
jgi:hypothetical protein